jgi:hypothetical protein
MAVTTLKTPDPAEVTAEIATTGGKLERQCPVVGSGSTAAKVVLDFGGLPLAAADTAGITLRITGRAGTVVAIDNVVLTGFLEPP